MEDRMQPIDDPGPIAGSRNLLTIFRRRLWIMMPAAVAVMLAVLLYAMAQPRMYEASAWLLISQDRSRATEAILTEADVWQSLRGDISMHRRIIRSTEIAEKVKEELEVEDSVWSLIGGVSVDRAPGTSANVLAITFRSTDPVAAKKIADSFARVYGEHSREQSTRSTVAAIEYVQRQIEVVASDVRTIEEEMAELERDFFETGIDISSTRAGGKLGSLISQIADSRIEMQALEAQIARTSSRLAQEPMEIEEVQEEPSHRAVALEQQLSKLHVEMQNKLQDYYEDSPEVRSLSEQIERIEAQLADQEQMMRSSVVTQTNPVYLSTQDKLISLYGQLDSLQARQAALHQQFEEQRALAEMAPSGSIAYNEMMRKSQGLQSVHSFLLSRLHELQLTQATAVSPVQVVREASEPRSPISPNYKSIMGFGVIAALLVAALAAVVVDQIDDTFANPDEIRDTLNARLVGVLPEIGKEHEREIQVGAANGATRTAFANAIRMLASTVRIEMARDQVRSLTITAAGRVEGKTLVSANLAAALASSGERVLVIDADLHRPGLHTLLDVDREPGLSNLLVGETEDPQDVMQDTAVPNLSVISAGPLPPSPVDLLGSAPGQEVMHRLNEMADYVIWDTPPAGFLADATVMSHINDRTLFVVGKQARRNAARETVQKLREIGVRLLGVCANQVRPTGGSYYYYYYYSDYYGDDE